MDKDKLNKYFEEATKHPNQFLEELGAEKNEHDTYIYHSSNGISSMNLALVLMSYKDWLLDNDILREK
jgi:hypothetical protein